MNSFAHTHYITELFAEATIHSNVAAEAYIHGFVTYDKFKLNGPQIPNMKKYNMIARGRIPITTNEFVDMSLITDKEDRVIDFHVVYAKTFTDKDDKLLLPILKDKPETRLLIVRTDIGQQEGLPSISVEFYDTDNKKIMSKVAEQDKN